MQKRGVVYLVTNDIDDKLYVGSSFNYESRQKQHRAPVTGRVHRGTWRWFLQQNPGVALTFTVLCDNIEDETTLERAECLVGLTLWNDGWELWNNPLLGRTNKHWHGKT